MKSAKPLGSHERLLKGAEEAGRQIVHSWIQYGPKEINHFEPESFPTGPLQNVSGGVLQAMLHDGVQDLAGLVTWFADAPDGVRSELIECAEGFAPRPEDCIPALAKLFEFHRQFTIELLTHSLQATLAAGEPTGKIVRKLAKVEAQKFVPPSSPVSPPDNSLDYMEPFEGDVEFHATSDRIQDMPFRLLGAADGVHRYLPDNGMTVIALAPSSHTSLNLMQLAPLQTWESVFPAKDGCKWSAAANAMIQSSQALPQYDPRAIRGRGCWIDGNDVVYHAGDKISINGTLMAIHAYQSPTRSIYEAGLGIGLDTDDSARNADAARVIELCESLSWDQPLYGKLLAGWMALAPISGALSWRPHVWVTGSSGSGKSWIMGNIISLMAGKSALYCQGNTSEAGIRGRLRSDALPVMFDEAEAENPRAASRMDGVIELARQASSEGGGITKGTATGGSITFLIRSMFCFASIGVAAVKKADTSRIAVLNLRKTDDHAQFERVKAIWRETVANPAFCAQIRARSIRNAMVIRHNAETFSAAAVAFTGDKRSADQIGTLLAGAYSLTSTREITPEAATEWLGRQEWQSYKVDAVDADENQCLAHLFSAPIRLETKNGIETITVDEAIDRARAEIVPGTEGLALIRTGIRVDGNTFMVANQHQGLERIYRDSPWAGAKWRNQLLRVPGAAASKTAARFGPGVVQKAVILPWIS